MDVAHIVEPVPYRPYAERVFLRELPKGLSAIYVVGYYCIFIRPVTSDKLTAAIQTFIQLPSTTLAILFYMAR